MTSVEIMEMSKLMKANQYTNPREGGAGFDQLSVRAKIGKPIQDMAVNSDHKTGREYRRILFDLWENIYRAGKTGLRDPMFSVEGTDHLKQAALNDIVYCKWAEEIESGKFVAINIPRMTLCEHWENGIPPLPEVPEELKEND